MLAFKKTTLLSYLLIAAVMFIICATLAHGFRRRLVVSGEALIKAVPDRARVTLGVEMDGPTAEAAQAASSRRISAVLEALESLGIPKEDLQTRAVSLMPLREYNPQDGRERLRGYRALNQIEVTVADPAKAGETLDAAVAAGANTTGEIQFYLDDPAALRAKALAEAFKDAEIRASSLAASIGRRLAGAISISEESVSAPEGDGEVMRAAKYDLAEADAAKTVEPGQVAVRARVRVEFAVR